MVASAFPLAQVALRVADERADAEGRNAGDGEGSTPGVDDLPFTTPDAGVSTPSSGAPGLPGRADGASSRPDGSQASQSRAGASGSVLLSQVMGAAQLMGYDVAVPELPTAQLAADQPLRAAILAWIAATGSVVPPDELTTQLLKADAMPIELQRDVALLLLSTIGATTLQRAALAKLSPAEIEWIYAHPEVGEQLAQGIETPATRYMAILAGKVDMRQSIAATLLLLEAVEATSDSLERAAAQQALAGLTEGDLAPETRAILKLLASSASTSSDADKVRLAAKLVALGAGVQVPEAGDAPTFPQAIQSLLDASGTLPDATQLEGVLTRASLLPDDLEGAVARLVLAEADAIQAANPSTITPTSQSEALVAMLVAVAEALPVLHKYNLFWSDAPDALRVSEWDPAARAGWAAHHAALSAAASGSFADLTRVGALMDGRALVDVPAVPERDFVAAYEAVAAEAGFAVNDSMRSALADGASRLDPATRDAAALLMSGAAESARLQREAFADLSLEEIRFLRFELGGLDALYASDAISQADLARLSRATALAQRVDADALVAGELVAASAMDQARALLDGRGAFQTQGKATILDTGIFSFLQRILPFGAARAQAPPLECEIVSGLIDQCGEDVVLRVFYPEPLAGPPGEFIASFVQSDGAGLSVGNVGGYSCDARECVMYNTGYDPYGFPIPLPSLSNRELLLVTGFEGTVQTPETTQRQTCPSTLPEDSTTYTPSPLNCRFETVPRYGAVTIGLDLGGDDTYLRPVAMVGVNASLPVSFHLDAGGDDTYTDPSPLYDEKTPLLRAIGDLAGHPTQGSALFGGVALLADAGGNDVYTAPTRSQAFGRLGLGMLADLGGDDRYVGETFVQGASTETMSLGSAILYDVGGADGYDALTGQGHGLGALLLDAAGLDRYRNEQPPLGVPMAHLAVVPGGDITTFDERADNRFWIDGPGSINVGLGVDTEVAVSGGQSDSDGFPDFVELAVGTDPFDPRSNPINNPTNRVSAISTDSDGDGWPDYVERALSTNPDNETGGAEDYPAGLPSGLTLTLPAIVDDNTNSLTEGIVEDGQLNPTEAGGADEAAPGFRGHDKIVDLRLPLQDAGTIDHGCTGTLYGNSSLPMGLLPGQNVYSDQLGDGDEASGGPHRNPDGSTNQACVYVSYQSSSPGEGNGTAPGAGQAGDPARSTAPNGFTYHFPAGILAVGDVIGTRYQEDYFVVVDLGGADNFTNGAGGGLVVRTTPRPDEKLGQKEESLPAVNHTFIVPSLVVNVDSSAIQAPTVGGLVAGGADDAYYNATRDFAQGSYFGVLVDTAGSDKYVAGNASQGSLGGALLDLGGFVDTYEAQHLSQGAALAGAAPGATSRADLPDNGNFPSDTAYALSVPSTQRRVLPGLLLDANDATTGGFNFFTSGSYSQGFATGFLSASPNMSHSPRVHGILASLQGTDFYTSAKGSRFSQGVGGTDGVGLLFDYGGGDTYLAAGRVSQGATISQTVGTNDPKAGSAPRPASGVLVDLTDSTATAKDTYKFGYGLDTTPRTAARNQNTTLQREESTVAPGTSSTSVDTRAYLNVGLHVDSILDPTNPEAFLAGVGGAGGESFVNEDLNEEEAFLVHLPTARLAIGKDTATTYTNEYAFVVDLGGENEYAYSAAGHIREALAQRGQDAQVRQANLFPGVYGSTLNLFPVTFLLDAGAGNSTYTSLGSFSQAAGFFGVGVLADLGGSDRFETKGEPVPALTSAWRERTIAIDAQIGATEWSGIDATPLLLQAERDPNAVSPWTLRVANDERSLYLALQGHTTSVGDDRRFDNLTLNLDAGRRLIGAENVGYVRTGIDSVVLNFTATGECVSSPSDRYYNATTNVYGYDRQSWSGEDVPRFDARCRVGENGDVVVELKKDIIETSPIDVDDLPYCYLDGVGFGITRPHADGNVTCEDRTDKLGLHLRLMEAGAGMYEGGPRAGEPLAAPFAWPAGATMKDGDIGYAADGSMRDEMESWGVVGLARMPDTPATMPDVTRSTMLTQGAAIAGVGVLAMLGTESDATLVAGDRSQGYAGFGGLALVLDAGGSDTYSAQSQSLGAADASAVALFVEAAGNERYAARNASLGWTPVAGAPPSGGSTSIFLDLGGDDAYAYRPNATVYDQFRNANSESATGTVATPPPEGNNLVWTVNQSVGADYQLSDVVRQTIAGIILDGLYGQTRTTLALTEYDPTEGAETTFENGCTDKLVQPYPGTSNPVASGAVCFVATVDTGSGFLQETASPIEELAGVDLGTVNGTVSVASVDFFIDRERVDTATSSIKITNDTTVWAKKIDVANLSDGVVRAKALPLFVADIEGYGVYVFADDVSNAIASIDNATKTVYINNAPKLSLELDPDYNGRADSTFSPRAYGDAQLLRSNYSVSPDASEFRYTAHNGWTTPVWNTSFPCVGVPDASAEPELCSILPFYLPADGTEKLTTSPGTLPAGHPSSLETETMGGVYSRDTNVLRTPLVLHRNGTFHLSIPGRETILPVAIDYATKITITLKKGGDEVPSAEDGQELYTLGQYVGVSPPSSDVPQVPGLKEVMALVRQAQDIVADTTESSRGTIVYNQVDSALTRVETGSPLQPYVNGDPGIGAFFPCRPDTFTDDPLTSGNIPAWLVWFPVQTVERNFGPVRDATGISPCSRNGDAVREASHTFDPVDISAVVDPVNEVVTTANDAVNNATDTDASRTTTLDLTDFFFSIPEDLDYPPEEFAEDGFYIDDEVVVIPAGYTLSLEFGYTATDSFVGRPGDGVRSQLLEAENLTLDTVCDNVEPAACDDPFLGAVGGGPDTTRQIIENALGQPINNTAGNLNNIFDGIPIGFFNVESGAPDQQPRLEIKVPSEIHAAPLLGGRAGTGVTVTLDNLTRPEGDQVVAVIRDGIVVEGDVAGQPTRDGAWSLFHKDIEDARAKGSDLQHVYAWNATDTSPRWTQHEVQYADVGSLEEGVYYVTVTATDNALSAQLTNQTRRSVLIDYTPPVTTITTSPFASQGSLTSGDKIPIRWAVAEVGSGIRDVYVYWRNATVEGDLTNPETWQLWSPTPYPPTVRSVAGPDASQDVVYLLTIGIDKAGNVEGSQNAQSLEDALAEALATKLANNAWTRVEVDKEPPLQGATSVLGGRNVFFEGTNYVFVRAGEPMSFAVCTRDAKTGIEQVVLRLDNFGDGTNTTSGTLVAKPAGSCAGGGTQRFVVDNWHANNTNTTLYPSGIWQVAFDVYDKAGNVVNILAGSVVLDHESPNVRVEPPVLPPGQTAVKLGDLVKIRLIADDRFGVDEANITVDASSLATDASALTTRPVRVDGVVYREAQFTVDRTNLLNALYTVVVRVPDLAGGVTAVNVTIAIDSKEFDFVPGTLRATNITHNSVVLRWNTTENASALAKFGLTNVTLTGRTPQDMNTTKEHALLVTGLSPRTKYFMKAVSVSPGGFTKESETIEVETDTALVLSVLSPRPGDKVSGLVDVAFDGRLLDSADFVTFTLEVRNSTNAPWTFVTTATRQGAIQHLGWNSTRFLDGTGYELRLTAEAGRDLAVKTIGPIMSDNTPASVLVLSPLLATNDTTPTISAEAADALSGLGAAPAQLFIDGEPAPGNMSVESGSNGRLRLRHEITTPLAAGQRLFELRVTDNAGNVARETWRVAIDGEAPVVAVNAPRYAPGTAAAKLGGTVTLNLTIRDLSGVSLVTADTSELSSQPTTRLVKIANTETWQGTFPVTLAAPNATKSVAIRVEDLAGNVREISLDIPVDNVAPTLSPTSLVETKHTRAVIDVPADEPILVNGTATAPKSPPVTAATSALARTARLVIDGLLPSRTYAYKLTAVDAAGNAVDLAGSFATERDVIAPSQVGPLSVVDLLNGTLRLSWTPATDDVLVSHYRVYRSADGVTFESIGETPETAYEDRGLPYEKTYVYKVAAVDYGGNEGAADERLSATVTAVPSISLGLVTPTVGSTSTTFHYSLTYTHPGGRAPAYVRIILDGVPQNMTLESGEPKTGAIYVYETRLSPHKRDAPHTYAFEASDGRYTVRFPDDGSVERGPLVSGDALADGPIAGFAAFAQRVPLGGAALMVAGLVMAVGIAAALRRTKKGGSK